MSVGSNTLRRTGTSDIGQLLAEQPALSFGGTAQAQQNAGSAGTPGEFTGGLTLANLRGLGTSRTLTLIDGKRAVGSDPGNSAVDLNSISPFLIDRIDVITGGASAVYGSDAVSGVVNIITRRDFEGVEAEVKGSSPTAGTYGSTYGFSGVIGHNFLKGRANVTISGSWDRETIVKANDIDANRNVNLVFNPASKTSTDGIPDLLLVPNVYLPNYSYGGTLGFEGGTGTLGKFTFDSSGKPAYFPAIVYTGTNNINAQYSSPCPTCFKLDDFYYLTPPLERGTFAVQSRFGIIEQGKFTLEAYGDVRVAQRDSEGSGQTLLLTARPINVAQNPFLDSTLKSQLLAQNIATTYLDEGVLGLGARTSRISRETVQFDGGFRGVAELPFAKVKYDVYGQYGETDISYLGDPRFYAANITAALDAVTDPATGMPACRVNVPSLQPANYVKPAVVGSCVPLNPFGVGNISQAARAFVTTTTTSSGTLTQGVAGASFSGDTSRFLRFWGGGALAIAGGFEYRKETSQQLFDPKLKSAITTQVGLQADLDASYDVNEFFVEAALPLIRDKPLAELLSLEIAYRTADYSTVGRVDASKFGGIWAPSPDIRFRGTLSRAVRAPNITEAFQAAQFTSTFISDPCSTALIGANAQRRANCVALGLPANFQAGNLSISLATQGNPNLTPETSDSSTVGFVLTPRIIHGLSMSFDYYDITIDNAIAFLSGATIANACVDNTSGPDPTYCSLITRNTDKSSPTYFQITGGQSTYVNTSKLTARGYDFQANYTFPALGGQVDASLVGSKLLERRTFTFQNNPAQYSIIDGYLGVPKLKINTILTYRLGDWAFTWTGRYISAQDLYDRSPGSNPEFQSPSKTPEEFYNDIYVEYKLPYRNTRVYVGATNLFDIKLPLIAASQLSTGTVYDQLGVVVFAGVRSRF